jgi:hypothetical protein
MTKPCSLKVSISWVVSNRGGSGCGMDSRWRAADGPSMSRCVSSRTATPAQLWYKKTARNGFKAPCWGQHTQISYFTCPYLTTNLVPKIYSMSVGFVIAALNLDPKTCHKVSEYRCRPTRDHARRPRFFFWLLVHSYACHGACSYNTKTHMNKKYSNQQWLISERDGQ